jgi:hypothetical protein
MLIPGGVEVEVEVLIAAARALFQKGRALKGWM